MGILEMKTAVITGGTRGFGLAIAHAFLREGSNVVIASRSQSAVDRALKELDAGERATGTACDVTHKEQVEALANLAVEKYGKFDIWINNAGSAGPYGPTMGLTTRAFTTVLHTNIIGTYYGSYVALNYFLPRKQGKLINILGAGSNGPVPYQNAYASTKFWMKSFTQTLARENLDSGVGIFALQPGMMITELLTDIEVISGFEEKLKIFPTVIRILANPPEIPAEKVVWTASSATDGQTGKVIVVRSLAHSLKGAVKEIVRRLSGKPEPPNELKIKVVPFGADE